MNTEVSTLANAKSTAITLDGAWMILMSPAHHFIKAIAKKNMMHWLLAAEAFSFYFNVSANFLSLVTETSNCQVTEGLSVRTSDQEIYRQIKYTF